MHRKSAEDPDSLRLTAERGELLTFRWVVVALTAGLLLACTPTGEPNGANQADNNPNSATTNVDASAAPTGIVPLRKAEIRERLVKMGHESPSDEDIERAREVFCQQVAQKSPVELTDAEIEELISSGKQPRSEAETRCLQVHIDDQAPGDSAEKPIKVSAKQLHQELFENRFRFGNNYDGRWVQITGEVAGIGKSSITLGDTKAAQRALETSGSLAEMMMKGAEIYNWTLSLLHMPQGNSLVLEASMGKSLTAVCKVEATNNRWGEPYSLESCQPPR